VSRIGESIGGSENIYADKIVFSLGSAGLEVETPQLLESSITSIGRTISEEGRVGGSCFGYLQNDGVGCKEGVSGGGGVPFLAERKLCEARWSHTERGCWGLCPLGMAASAKGDPIPARSSKHTKTAWIKGISRF
jgi:hypothetical protein